MDNANSPKMTSAAYFERAKKLWLTTGGRPQGICLLDFDENIDDGVDQERLNALLDPANWAEEVRKAGGKPRVYLDVYLNQSRNLEVRWASGSNRIFYKSDFDIRLALYAEDGQYGARRSSGELMWVKGFGNLSWSSKFSSELHRTLLMAYAARVDELASLLAEKVDLIGYDRIDIAADGSTPIVSSLSGEEIWAAREESSATTFSA